MTSVTLLGDHRVAAPSPPRDAQGFHAAVAVDDAPAERTEAVAAPWSPGSFRRRT